MTAERQERMRSSFQPAPVEVLLVALMLAGGCGVACTGVAGLEQAWGVAAPPELPAIEIVPKGPVGPTADPQEQDLGGVEGGTLVFVRGFPVDPADVGVTLDGASLPLDSFGSDYFAFVIPNGVSVGEHTLEMRDTLQNQVFVRAVFTIE